jgi:hypothetical protein
VKPLAFALLALLAAGPAVAQAGSEPAPPEASGDGIHVVGNWTLDVRDADGTLVESRAFHNDLAFSGARHLIDLLTRQAVHGDLELHISGAQGPCDQGDGDRFRCVIAEPEDSGISGAITKNLVFEVLPPGDGLPRRIRYTGSFVADFDDDLTDVNSWWDQCDYGEFLTCDASNSSRSSEFTERELDTPLPVEAGQTVNVTFELSFE